MLITEKKITEVNFLFFFFIIVSDTTINDINTKKHSYNWRKIKKKIKKKKKKD